MHTTQRVGQAVACGACSHVIGMQGTARAAAGSDREVLLAVLDGPLLVGAGNQMLEADGVGGVAGDGALHVLLLHDGNAFHNIVIKTAKGYIDNGQLIPDELMIDILASVYDSFGKDHAGVIFDGFPRTTPQAEALKKMLSERGHKIAAMIELAVPEDELMARLINRGKESGRSDDNEETIKKRLNVYHTQTAPLIDWYEKEGIHHHIEGLGTVDEIFARVCNVIDNL